MKRLLDYLQISVANPSPMRPVLPDDAFVLSDLKEYVHFSEFKRILDKVITAHAEDQLKSIAVLSELPGEGKTFFTAALATGLSEVLQARILVIDTQTFNAEGHLTLDRALEIDDLANGGPTEKTLLVKTDILPLTNLSQGKATEFRIGDVIKKYSDKYDLLIFDTSALSAKNRNNIDPWVVARHVDTNLLVVGRQTLRKNFSPIFFERKNANKLKIAGLVFNEGTNYE